MRSAERICELRLTIYDSRLVLLFRALAIVCAIAMSRWASLPWLVTVGLGLLGAGTIAATSRNERLQNRSLALIWLASLLIPLAALLTVRRGFPTESYLDPYYGILAWVIGAALWPCNSGRKDVVPKQLTGGKAEHVPANNTLRDRMAKAPARWKLPAMIWMISGTLLWLAGSYVQNLRGTFYLGLGITIAVSVLSIIWFRLPFLIIQLVSTLILLCIGLPLADLLIHPPNHLPNDPQILKQYSSFTAAQKDPAAFEAWWSYFWDQWLALEGRVMLYDPHAPIPLRLRPNSEGTLVQSRITINGLGFRGKEITNEKGDAYRIVALGESTTFGFTINAEDRPWPELLEDLIRDRLKPARQVEVINAGLPSADLVLNLRRFPSQILPMKPDLIICYHGFNGFHLLDPAIPRASGKPPPIYRKRPLRLLADCEYRAKLMLYRRAHMAGLSSQAPTFSNLMGTAFARAYRDLIQIADTNHIRLALANFCMAANDSSPPQVVEFFRPRTPRPYWEIKANAAHSQLVHRLAEEHPEVTLVDTHPHLDGDPNQFIDLIHFIHSGEVHMAENVFEGIKPILQKDLAVGAGQNVSY